MGGERETDRQTEILSIRLICLIANTVSRVAPRNKMGHPAHSHKLSKQVPMVSNTE